MGRKPVADKAVRFIIYPRESRLDKLGKEKITEICLEAIEREYKKMKK